jgi:putative hemolysin
LGPAAAAPTARGATHIVDVLIAERAPTLVASPVWPLLRPALNGLLNHAKAVAMADAIAPLRGLEAMEAVSRLLSVELEARGLEHVPRQGRCVLVANHPTGIADGVAAWDALKRLRPDLRFYANSDAHRVCAGFVDVLIPVEWELTKRTRERTRETLRLTQLAFEAEAAIMIFPAGRLARMRDGVLRDPEWMASAVSIARKNDAPLVPIHMTGPWSFWFHAFDKVSKELRDITLFHELLNKRGRRFTLSVGPPIPPEALAGDAGKVTLALKDHVELVMPADPTARFAPP